MAKVLENIEGEITHLRGEDGKALCGEEDVVDTAEDGVLTCPECAAIALHAIELSTKAERREWRKL